MSRKNASLVAAFLILLAVTLLIYFGVREQSDSPRMSDLVEAPAVLANSTAPATLVPPDRATTKHEGRQQRKGDATVQKKNKIDAQLTPPPPHVASIDELLKSDKPADQEVAFGRINAEASAQPKSLERGLVKWLPAMLKAGHYEDVETDCVAAILFKPQDMPVVAQEQRARVIAALGAGRYEQALALAKGYYDVATLDFTKDAELLVAEALKHQAEPSGISLTDASTLAIVQNAIKTTAIDGLVYTPAIDKLSKTASYNNWIGRGNLLLLEGRGTDALAAFEASLASINMDDKGDAKKIPVVADAIVRAVRAVDGSTDRADALVRAIRQSDLGAVQGISAPLSTALGFTPSIPGVGRRLPMATENPPAAELPLLELAPSTTRSPVQQ